MYVISLLFFSFFLLFSSSSSPGALSLAIYSQIANERGHQNHPSICFKEKMDHLLSAQLPADKLYYVCFYYV